MNRFITHFRIAHLVLAALLALPVAPGALPVEAKNRSRIVTKAFRNPASFNLPFGISAPVSASRYPLPIEVRGLQGPIRDVNVTVHDLFHTNSSEIEALLVGPGGQTAIVMTEVGDATADAGVTLRFDDEAAESLLDEQLSSGTFRPTNYNGAVVAFNAPAPPVTSANAALSVFDGGNPNGTWRLFVQDRLEDSNTGTIAGGWTLEIEAKEKARKKKR